jgi:hypothetical protein
MGIAIVVFAAFTVVVLAWAALRAESGPVRIAALAGLAFLLIGQGAGGPMIAKGIAAAEATGAVPEAVRIGANGQGKLPHGVGIHALQVLAGLAVLVNGGALRKRARRRTMLIGVAGYAVVLTWALAQTYLGRAPLDLTPSLLVTLLAGIGLVGAAYAVALLRLRGSPADATRPADAKRVAATVAG